MGYNVDLLLKIAGIGIGLGILHTVLAKSGKEEFAFIATLTGLALVFTMMIGLLTNLFRTVRTLFNL